MHGRPRRRLSPRTDSGLGTGWDKEEAPICWHFLTPFVRGLAGERSLVFSTRAARVGSLNALGAVAGAGVRAIFGVSDVDFCSMHVCEETFGGDERTDWNGNDGGAVAGKINTCGFIMFVGLERGTERGDVEFREVIVANGVVLTAAFGGTIWAVGAGRGADEEGAHVLVLSTGLEVVGSSEEAVVVCGSFGFECCCMRFARFADASTALVVGWVFSVFEGEETGVVQVTGRSDSECNGFSLVSVS